MRFSLADSTVITTNPSTPRARRSSSHGFFVGMSTVLLALVLVGFAPTFYLRAYRGTSQLPPLVQRLPLHLYVHGVVLTLWFVLFFVQTALVASHRTNRHRRLGVAGTILAGAVVIATLITLVRAVPRFMSNGLPEALMPRFAMFIIGDLGSLLVFTALVACGVSLRRRPEAHRRLMLLASISIVGPAVSRVPGAVTFPLLVVVVQIAFLLAVLLHDVVSTRRVHPATAWGAAWILGMSGLSTAVALSGYGQAFIRAFQ